MSQIIPDPIDEADRELCRLLQGFRRPHTGVILGILLTEVLHPPTLNQTPARFTYQKQRKSVDFSVEAPFRSFARRTLTLTQTSSEANFPSPLNTSIQKTPCIKHVLWFKVTQTPNATYSSITHKSQTGLDTHFTCRRSHLRLPNFVSRRHPGLFTIRGDTPQRCIRQAPSKISAQL